jgi:signal transduction histidine kinase
MMNDEFAHDVSKTKILLMKKTQLALFCLFLHLPFLNAQETVADYKQALSMAKDDSVRQHLSSELASLYAYQINDSAFLYFNQALRLAEKRNDQNQIGHILTNAGTAYSTLFKDDVEAIKWLNKSLVVTEKTADYKTSASTYVTLGIIYDHQNMDDAAEQFLNKAILNAEKSNNVEAKAGAYHVAAAFLAYKRNDLKTAEEYELKALNLAEQLTPMEWITYCSNYCETLLNRGEKEKAAFYYQKAVALIKEKNIVGNNAADAEFIVLLHGTFQKYDLMEAAFAHLLTVVQPSDTEVLANAYDGLSDFRAKQGNYKGAFAALLESNKLHAVVNEKRLTDNTRIEATKLKGAFDLAQKEQELKTQRWLLWGCVAILALTLGFGGYFYRSRQQITQQKTALEDLNKTLKDLNKTKDRLLSIIAHDLRSPIGWLKDSFDLMDNTMRTPEKMTRFLAKSKEQVERVYNTMENLLVWALAQRNGLNPRFETVSIAEIVVEQIDNVRDFAQRKGITIQNQAPQYLTVWADRNQLGIVLNNLLQNALKFTPSGGTISLSVEPTSDKQLTIKIADSGVGMDIEAWQQQQKTQTILSKEGTAKEKGTGLGLFLVKEIVDKNGGTLAIESEKGMGTTVSVGLKKGN